MLPSWLKASADMAVLIRGAAVVFPLRSHGMRSPARHARIVGEDLDRHDPAYSIQYRQASPAPEPPDY